MMGEGTAPKDKTPALALAGKNWSFEALNALMRQIHRGSKP